MCRDEVRGECFSYNYVKLVSEPDVLHMRRPRVVSGSLAPPDLERAKRHQPETHLRDAEHKAHVVPNADFGDADAQRKCHGDLTWLKIIRAIVFFQRISIMRENN